MILIKNNDIGFLRHNPKDGKLILLEKGTNLAMVSPSRILSSTLCHYAIPCQVAPQQSLVPLHVTVNTKIIKKYIFYNQSFQHLG